MNRYLKKRYLIILAFMTTLLLCTITTLAGPDSIINTIARLASTYPIAYAIIDAVSLLSITRNLKKTKPLLLEAPKSRKIN